MVKRNMWTISLEDSSVCFKYGYQDSAAFQGNFGRFTGMVLADANFKAMDLMLKIESESIKAADCKYRRERKRI